MSFSTPITLSGKHVILEPLGHHHTDDLSEAVLPGKLWETWYTRIPSPETMTAEIDRRLGLQRAGTMLPWAVISAESGAAVGMTTFMNIDEANRRVEIGSTWLGQLAQRTPINTEAKLLALGYAFDQNDAIAVEFRTHWHNQQSRAAIARLGAKQDGILRNSDIWRDGTLRDTVVFSIIASEWPTVKLSLSERLRTRA